MNKYVSLSLFVILTILGNLEAQRSFKIEGVVTDSSTGERLGFVNIFDQVYNTGTFTGMNGHFEIKLQQLPTTLIFSFIGYENYFLPLDQVPNEELKISLNPSIFRLTGVEVIASPKVEKLTESTFTVKDFVIENNKILLVKFGGIAVGDFLELRDLDGHILHSLSVEVKGSVEYLHQSCLGNIHLVGMNEVIEVDINSEKISLISKYPRSQFDQIITPCVEASDDFVYYKRSRLQGQQIRFDFISKSDRKIEKSVVVSDDENVLRMFEELALYNTSEAYYTAGNENPNNPNIVRPEVFDAWIGIFYKPIFSPLYNTGEEVCLFNHTLGFLQFYDFDGTFKRLLPINYQREKKWDKKILKDRKTGKFYTVHKDAVGKKFYEINLTNGSVTPAFKMSCSFVEKMIIYDGYLYYQDSGIIPSEVNRIIHKVKVN